MKKIVFIIIVYSLMMSVTGFTYDRRTPVVDVFENVSPMVVNISTERVVVRRYDPFFDFRDKLFDRFFDDFFSNNFYQKYKTTSIGSGVIIDPEGYIITNEHVISKASRIVIKMNDGKEFEGILISADHESDLAVVKINSPILLKACKLGYSEEIMTGESVIALGNPFGLTSSVTTGVVSATGRTIKSSGKVVLEDLIQTDALINPGNSGGPLLNVNSELIGINTAIYSEAQGIGFAIPVNNVRQTLGIHLSAKRLKNVWTGINPVQKKKQVVVGSVDAGSPAEKKRIQKGDIIFAVGEVKVNDVLDYERILRRYDPRDRVLFTILNQDVLERREDSVVEIELEEVPAPSGKELAYKRFGLKFELLTKALARKFNVPLDFGFLVTEIVRGTPAYLNKIQIGDIVVQIGNYILRDETELNNVMKSIKTGDNVFFLIIREDYKLYSILKAE